MHRCESGTRFSGSDITGWVEAGFCGFYFGQRDQRIESYLLWDREMLVRRMGRRLQIVLPCRCSLWKLSVEYDHYYIARVEV